MTRFVLILALTASACAPMHTALFATPDYDTAACQDRTLEIDGVPTGEIYHDCSDDAVVNGVVTADSGKVVHYTITIE